MKTFIKIVYWLLGILAVLLIIAYLLPKTYKVERNIQIKANSDVIYNLTCNFSNWHLWVAWTKKLDSTAQFDLIGPNCQVGTTWKWNGKILGNGEMILTETVPGQLVAYDLAFNEGKYRSLGKIVIEAQNDSCKVSWMDEGDLGNNPLNRYMGLFMDKIMGPDFEKGLLKLKAVAEDRNDWPKIEETQLPEQVALLIRDSAVPETYNAVMGNAYGELMCYVFSKGLKTAGYPFAIYLTWDSVTMKSTMDIGIPVEKAASGKGRIRVEKLPSRKVIMANYFGPYDKTANTYYILEQYIREAGMEINGNPWEIYVTDPMKEKDTTKWQTNILFPVK